MAKQKGFCYRCEKPADYESTENNNYRCTCKCHEARP